MKKRDKRKPNPPALQSPPLPEPQLKPAEFWAGEFGNEYTKRNRVNWKDRVPFWEHIIEVTQATSFLEVGTNAGWNLQAIRSLDKEFAMTGVDVNEEALREAQDAGLDVEVLLGYDVAKFFGAGSCELAFTSGVLIHIPQEELIQTMTAIRDVSSQYVLAVEYDSPEDQEIDYRGHSGKLWKRPWGKLYQALGLSLVETGPAQGFVDCHYWLLEKT
jgi:spore coat polysaccharide biosynthesis protein SpsF